MNARYENQLATWREIIDELSYCSIGALAVVLDEWSAAERARYADVVEEALVREGGRELTKFERMAINDLDMADDVHENYRFQDVDNAKLDEYVSTE